MDTCDKHYDIVLIDSGCDCAFWKKHYNHMDIIAVEFDDQNMCFSENVSDSIGHGTEIIKCIFNVFPDAQIMMIKAFDQLFSINDKHLLQILRFIDSNINTSIISICGGMLDLNRNDEIHDFCQKLRYDRNTIIIGAMGNDKSIRYPGALDCVMGVDILDNSNDIYYLKDHYVNFLVGSKKVYPFTQSTSFAVAFIAAYLAKLKYENECCSFEDLEALIIDNKTEICNIPIIKKLNRILVLALDDFQNLRQKLAHLTEIEVVLATHKYKLYEAYRYFPTVITWSKLTELQRFDLIINYNINNLEKYMNSNAYNRHIQSSHDNNIPFLKMKQNKLFFEKQHDWEHSKKSLKDYDIILENNSIICDSTVICSDSLSPEYFNVINSFKRQNPHTKFFYVDNILSIVNDDAFIESIGQDNVSETFHRSALYMRWNASMQHLPLVTCVMLPSLLSNKYSRENIIDFDTIVKQMKCNRIIFILKLNNEYSNSIKRYIQKYQCDNIELSIIRI